MNHTSRMKRIITMILTFLLIYNLIPEVAFAEDVNASKTQIKIEKTSTSPGATVDVKVSIKNNPGVLGAFLRLEYDEGLTLVDARNGDAFEPLTLTKPGKYESACNFTWDGQELKEDEIKDGIILVLTFNVSTDVPNRTNLNVKMTSANGAFVDNDLNPIEIEITDGLVTVNEYHPGDLNGDNLINSTDVILLRRYIAGGYNVNINEDAADFNGDWDINTTDVILLRRYIAGGYGVEPISRIYPKPSSDKHSLIHVDAKDPTCADAGHIEYWHCSDCGKYFADKDATEEISDITIPATDEHTPVKDPAVEPTEDAEGLTEGSHCSVCGKILVPQNPIEKLKPTEYSIEYDLSGSDTYLQTVTIENENPTSYTSKAGVDHFDPVEVAGYTFDGWYDGPGNTALLVTSIPVGTTGNKKLYARWTKVESKIIFDSPLVPIADKTYKTDEGATLTQPSLAGYTFAGWSDDDGNLVTKIKKGTTGNITLHANWTSKRNQTRPVSQLGEPVINIDEDSGTIQFAYEIGTIENVPLYTIENLGNKASGITYEKTVTSSGKISETNAKTIAETVANSTTKSSAWTLSKDWNSTTSKSETHANEVDSSITESQMKSSSGEWNISSNFSNGGTNSVTTEAGVSSKIGDKKTTGQSFEGGVSVPISCVSLGAKYGNKVEKEHSEEFSTNAKVSNTDTKTWNANVGYSSSGSTSQSNSISKTLAKKISDSVSYNISNSISESHVNTESTSTTTSNSREYASTLTYYTEEQETSAIKISNENAPEGYYRIVCAGKMHVFGVVNYDIATQSYGVYTFNVIEDDVYEFLDYSRQNPSFNDYENGVLPFAVPYEVNDYVDNLVGATNGLRIDLETGKVVKYTENDKFVVVPQYMAVDVGDGHKTVEKITGISSEAFAGKDLLAIKLPNSLTEIPDNAFKNCTSFDLLDAESIRTIGNNAFEGCSSLKKFDVPSSVTELGMNAFNGVDEISVTACNADVAKATVNSGAKNITLNLSSVDDTMENDKLIIPETADFVQINGGNRAFTNLQIVSDAKETMVNGINLKDNITPPLKISSAKIGLNRVVANSGSWVMIATNNNAEVSLFGTNQLTTSTENAILCRNISLTDIGTSVIGKLKVSGNIMVCGEITGQDLLEISNGSIKIINEETYNSYLNDTWTDWSEWSTTPVEASADVQVETKVQYRYSDKQTTTSTNSVLSGWTQTGSTTTYGNWGAWSAWNRGSKASSDTVNVESKTVYGYYYFRCPNCGAHMHGYPTCYTWAGGCGKSNMSLSNAVNIFDPTPWSSANCYEFHGTGKYATDSLTAYGRLFQWSDNGVNSWAGYRYRTRSKTVTYSYYKWGDWSSWSDGEQTATDNRKVETRIIYRYKSRIM